MIWDNINLRHDHPPPFTIDLNDEFVELDPHHQDHHFFINTTTTTLAPPSAAAPPPTYTYNYPSSSSSSSQTFFFSALDHADPLPNYHHQGKMSPPPSSADPEGGGSSSSDEDEMKVLQHMGDQGMNNESQQQNIPKQLGTSVKWMSSKMRIMRKMMSPPDQNHTSSSSSSSINYNATNKQFNYHHHHHQHINHLQPPPNSPTHDHQDHNSSSTNVSIRVCSDCNTTKTPLWRSGPRGPKSLCNACGIRQRKARRAAMAAAAVNGGSGAEITAAVMPPKSNKLQCKNKRSSVNGTCTAGPLKKKCKVVVQHSDHPPVLSADQEILLKDSDTSCGSSINHNNNKNNSGTKKLCFEDLKVILSNNSAFQRAVFPQDEKEGAILLMALSYGLVQS